MVEKAVFKIIVTQDNDFKDVIVEIRPSRGAQHWGFWKAAAEYMFHSAAQKSQTGYEKAVELMIRGSMGYKDLRRGNEPPES